MPDTEKVAISTLSLVTQSRKAIGWNAGFYLWKILQCMGFGLRGTVFGEGVLSLEFRDWIPGGNSL